MISTSKKSNYQIPGIPIKQLLGKQDSTYVPNYSEIKDAKQNIDCSRFQDYMLFQSATVCLRLCMQRLFLSYPFLKTRSNSTKDFTSFSAVQPQLQNYFNYIQNASPFEKYFIRQTKTQNISLTSTQNDIIIVPYFDLYNASPRRRFQVQVETIRQKASKFDNGVVTKSFWGLRDGTKGLIYNRDQYFQFTDRDKTYQNQVPRNYDRSINRRGQIYNLLPSLYYRGDLQFESLLNIFRQNYDKLWFKNKAVKNQNKVSYDKYDKQYLGGFVKQMLRNRGIEYYDINPNSISNIILYNYAPKHINPRNVDYIPIGFSYRHLSDQFAYRMFVQKNLLTRAKGTRQPLERLVNMYGLRNSISGDFTRNPTWNDIVDFQRYYNIDSLFKRDMSSTGSYMDLQSTIDDQVFNILSR